MHKKTSKRILKTFQKHSKSICSNREIDSNQIHKVSVYILVIILQNSLYSYGLKTVSFCLETFPLPEKKDLPLHLVDLNETWEDTRNNKSKLWYGQGCIFIYI